jgi:hypothetical protein
MNITCSNCGTSEDGGEWLNYTDFTVDEYNYCSCECAQKHGARHERERNLEIFAAKLSEKGLWDASFFAEIINAVAAKKGDTE